MTSAHCPTYGTKMAETLVMCHRCHNCVVSRKARSAKMRESQLDGKMKMIRRESSYYLCPTFHHVQTCKIRKYGPSEEPSE